MTNAFIGCGLAAKFRAKYLPKNSIKYCFDTNPQTQSDFQKEFNCESFNPYNLPVDVDNVFVCTTHDCLFDFAKEAIFKHKNVCVEKPGALSSKDLTILDEMAKEYNKVVHVGYTIGNTIFENHRWGQIQHIRAYYAHGARPDYDKEWRMSDRAKGGGVDYDLLPHLIHFSLMFDSFEFHSGFNKNVYWNSNCPDYSNVNLVRNNHISNCIVNVCDWKNTFEIVLTFHDKKVVIKDLNSQTGKYTFINYSSTGPGIKPFEEVEKWERNFWRFDTQMFLDKIANKITTDLSREIKVLKILEKLNEK